VIYKDEKTIWSSGTSNRKGATPPYMFGFDDFSELQITDFYDNIFWEQDQLYHPQGAITDEKQKSSLYTGEKIGHFEDIKSLYSQGGVFWLTPQIDLNLVLYDRNKNYWSTGTYKEKSTHMQPSTLELTCDGELKLTDNAGNTLWKVDRGDHPLPVRLIVQPDRNIVLYDKNGKAYWASETYMTDTMTEKYLDSIEILTPPGGHKDCDKSFASKTFISNSSVNDLVVSETIEWSVAITSESTFSKSVGVTVGMDVSGDVMGADYSASVSTSANASNQKTTTHTKTIDIAKTVVVTAKPGKRITMNLIGCQIDDARVDFMAKFKMIYSSGAVRWDNIKGSWTGTSYSNFSVVVKEFDL
jgi:hypothetical protein